MHFKDTQNNLHFIDDASFAHLLPQGSIEITDEEAEQIRLASIPQPTLADLKLAKRQELNFARDHEERSGFTYLGAVLDSDQASVIRIGVAGQAASLNPDFSVDWTTKDNGVLTMNQAEMLALPGALAAFGAALHYKARALKAQVEAATTPEELEAIIW